MAIEAATFADGAYAIVREERVGWVVIAVCPDEETANEVFKRMGGALPYVGLGDAPENGRLFLRPCVLR